MRKRQAAIALALLSAVSSLCLKGMKKVGEHIEERMKKRNQLKSSDLSWKGRRKERIWRRRITV